MSVKSYLMTVISLVILTETAKYLLPRGKTKKVVDTILALIVVVTLVSPVLRLGGVTLGEVVGAEYHADETYLTRIDNSNARLVKSEVAAILRGKDVSYSEIEVVGENGKIKKVKIYLSDKVIDENSEHIIVTEITRSIAAYIGICEEAVEIVD